MPGFYQFAPIMATVVAVSLATTLGQSRFHGSDQPTEEIRLTRRTLRPNPGGWSGLSPRTQLILAAIGILTAVLGIVLATQVVSAQDLRAEGRADADALTAALDAARADVGALQDAVDAAGATSADARALSDLLAPRTTDLSADAVAGVAAAAGTLSDLLAEPVTEPALPEAVGSPGSLPGRYVSAGGRELEQLRERVAHELDRLPAVGQDARDRVARIAAAQADVATSVGVAVAAAEAATPQILAAGPEASAEARTRLEQAVAALVALGETPDAGAATREAFTAYFTAADGFRLSHEEAVAAREAAEQAAAEAAAAEEEARRAAEEQQPWWEGWWPPGRGDGRPPGK